jgi:hypothetical protein
MSKGEAMLLAHMQIQPSEMRASLVVDLDATDSMTRLLEMDYPDPNLLMVNPENGHAHAIWQLKGPVSFAGDTRHRPQRAFLDLQRQITVMQGGDRAYGAYMVKTPGHRRWETLETKAPLYGMAELFEAIPLGVYQQAQAQKTQRPVVGEGRHNTLWEIGRRWAYGAVKKHKHGTAQGWEAVVLAEFQMLNSFALPLTAGEVRSLARNVARWTWERRETLNAGENRAAIRSWEREPITPEEAKANISKGVSLANIARKESNHEKIINAIALLAGAGNTSPSKEQIAAASGVSTSTVGRWRKERG